MDFECHAYAELDYHQRKLSYILNCWLHQKCLKTKLSENNNPCFKKER